MASSRRLIIVGGGILGTMHALEGVRRGYNVIHLERDVSPRGASLRNFGLIWVSGRAPGPEVALALRARERWEDVGMQCLGTGFRAAGSMTVALTHDELDVLEFAVALPDATSRGLRLLTAAEALTINPSLAGPVLGALYCDRDAIVEPRLTTGALREFLDSTGNYTFLAGHDVVELGEGYVFDHRGARHDGDLVICCPGAVASGMFAEVLAGAPLRRVRLQMLETAPFDGELTTAIADGDSLRYYPAFAGPARDALHPQSEPAASWRAQLLLVKRLGGHLTIGDTHSYAEPFAFDLADEPYQHLLAMSERLLGRPVPAVERRWGGIYSEVTDENLLYLRREVAPGVVVVTGPGGRGMTMSPAIAEETFT